MNSFEATDLLLLPNTPKGAMTRLGRRSVGPPIVDSADIQNALGNHNQADVSCSAWLLPLVCRAWVAETA